jgi:regulator of cell morphogenesis and NO signaling
MKTLDVTQIEPRFKHPTIFEWFDALSEGNAFIIHNDHDPIPLYYQMIAERGEVFEWEYLKKGPEEYEVKITRLNKDEKSKTLGELVTSDYRKAEVFRKFGLDFCCGGHKTLKAVCEDKGLNIVEVESAIREIDRAPQGSTNNFNDWELDFLADYIVNKHHKYVSASIPGLIELCVKVEGVHGDKHPELKEITENFRVIAEELLSHMPKEETVLFPYIKKMVEAKSGHSKLEKPGFGSIENPVTVMKTEHYFVGEKLENIKELSGAYMTPADACTSYKVLFAKLHEFADDLSEHIHLENNILFPKAIALEKELLKSV